jgi:hypothetical protein
MEEKQKEQNILNELYQKQPLTSEQEDIIMKQIIYLEKCLKENKDDKITRNDIKKLRKCME